MDTTVEVAQSVNVQEILVWVITAGGALLSVLLAWAARKLNRYLGSKIGAEEVIKDEVVRKYLNDAVDWGVTHAIAKVRERRIGQFSTNNQMIAVASNHVVNAVPQALEHFGVTPEKLAAMVEARLEAADPGSIAKKPGEPSPTPQNPR